MAHCAVDLQNKGVYIPNNNCGLVLLTQLIKLMVDVTHTIYMSVLVVVLLKETLITVVSYCYKYISLVLV